MDKRMRIYLAGKMSGLSFETMNDWREKIKKLFEHYSTYYSVDLSVINPVDYYNFKEKKHQSEREVMQFDLSLIKSSDIIVVNLDGLNTSIGSCIELYEAYKRDIPVIAIGTYEMYENIHSWVKECITRIENSDEQAVKYIRDFYFTN